MSMLQRTTVRHGFALPRQLHSSITRHAPKRSQRCIRLQLQTRYKQSTTKTDRKAAISRSIASNTTRQEATSSEGIYGLRPIDYSILPPIRNSPPPPPPKPGLQKYLFPLTLLFTASIVGYFYVNNKNDNYEYWRAMQSGEALELNGDDDDDVEYEDDEEEE